MFLSFFQSILVLKALLFTSIDYHPISKLILLAVSFSYCDPVEVAALSGNPGDGVVTPSDCPAGYYCPTGTGAKSSFPCAVGTFSNTTQLQSQTQCQQCTGGYFCDTPGKIAETGWFFDRRSKQNFSDCFLCFLPKNWEIKKFLYGFTG